MGKRAKSSLTEEIDSILQRLKRSNETALFQPPNQAQTMMGRRLGACFLEHIDEEISHEILQVLNLSTTNPSVPQAFFQTLQSTSHVVPESWISTWIQQAQDAERTNTLEAILSFYAWHCRQAALNSRLDPDRITNTYFQLQPLARPQFASILAQQACPDLVRSLLSPIMAASVLTLSTHPTERTVVLDILLRSCWSSELTLDTISWHVESLVMLIDYADEALALHWLTQIMDMMTAADDDDVMNVLTQVIREVLPHFFQSTPPSLQPILSSALQISQRCSSLDDETIFQLTAMVLSTPIQDDCQNLLQVLEQLSNPCSKWTGSLRTMLSSIFAQDEFLVDLTSKLRSVDIKSGGESGVVFKILGIDQADLEHFLELAGNSVKKLDVSKVPVITQNSFLFLACGLLLQYESDTVKKFVKTLLQKFPHLGIPMLPVLLDSIQKGASDGRVFLKRLEFLCESVVHDPHCAQEVWNLLGLTLTQKDEPLSVRLAAIRLYSTLCANNRRLYRRIVDSLGNFVEERQAEIRLAVVTVVCDMAEQDLIRDVSDVIGWLQTYLRDDHPSIVHLSIMSLHFMVINGELDFDLVIKVLGKRLCAVGDVSQVLQLAPLVMEALVVLLGDGEVEDEEGKKRKGGVSPQVSSAVQTLIALAESNIFAEVDSESANRLRFNIFQSLSNYSLEALGVDEEAIKALTTVKTEGTDTVIPEASHRYVSLCNLVKETVVNPPLLSDDTPPPVDMLLQKLIYHEEEMLGTSVWQKGHKNLSDTKKVKKAKQVSESALSALPNPEQIYEAYDTDPSASTAIASLLCFNGKNIDRLADFAGDLSNETLSPMLRTLNIQGWLHAMSRVWSQLTTSSSDSLVDDLKEVVQEIQGWRDTSGNVDYVYLALVSLSLYVPHRMRASDGSASTVELGPIVDSITADAERACKEHQFTDLDIGHLCLAFTGVRALQAGSSDVFARALETLKKACAESAGSIGLFYGMSFMAQSIPTGNANARSMITSDRHQRQSWVGQIVGCLVNELQLCFEEGAPAIVTLVASLSSASPSPGLLEHLKGLGALSIQSSSAAKANLLLISLGASTHSLVGVHADLLQGLFHLLLKLPWGSGVDYALASIASNSATAAVFQSSDIELLKEKLSETSNAVSGLYLSACLASETNGTGWIENNMEVIKTFDQVLSLIPVVGSLPVLATVETSSLASAKLFPHATSSAISLVLNALNTSDSETAIVLRGLLSSMSLPAISHSNAVSLTAPSSSTTKAVNLSLDANKLPTPNDGTLLFHLVSLIREELRLLKAGNSPNLPLLCRLLRCLAPLSLPGQFATDMLGPLMLENDYSELNVASLQLLLSQFTGRRRAAMEGRDFVSLAAQVMSLHETTLLDNGGTIFYSGISDLIRKSSTDLVDSIISQSWQNCLFKLKEHGDTGFACKWLEAMAPILTDINTKNTLSLSPRTSSVIRLFIIQDVFRSLVTASSIENIGGVFDELVKCLFEISNAFLDEQAFFSFDSKKETLIGLLWKARCIAALMGGGYIEEKERLRRMTTSLFAWFSRQTLKGETQLTMYKVGFTVASAVGGIDDSTKNQVALLLLEAMLVHGQDVVALDLLALVVNSWGTESASLSAISLRGSETLPTLSGDSLAQMWRLVLQELPTNLGSLARRTKTERLLSNRIVQVRNSWADKGVPQEKLSLLLRMLNSCKNNDAAEKETIAIMTSKLSSSME